MSDNGVATSDVQRARDEERTISQEKPIELEEGDSNGTALSEPGGGVWLDLSRTQPPVPRSGVIARARLLDELRASPSVRVVSVVAPAGYGKTTLLGQWAALHGRQTAWLTLDAIDNDPAILLAHLLGALGITRPHRAASRDEVIVPGPTDRRLLYRAVDAIRRRTQSTLVVLDDAHVISDPAVIDAIEGLVDRLPAGSRLAIGARSPLALPYSRWRATGALLELDAGRLALDQAESRTLLRELQPDITAEEAEVIRQRTMGWPAATYLAALALREHRAAPTDGSALGDTAHISDYLESQVLSSMTRAERTLLARTSILDSLSGPLCDAVLMRSGTAARLRSLAGKTLFLSPLDPGRNWYRCHDLLREHLRRQLQLERPELVPELHRRASAWYAGGGEIEEAVEHAFAGGLADEAVRLVVRSTKLLHEKGADTTLNRWYSRFDADIIQRHPAVASMAAWLAALDGRPEDFERWSVAVLAGEDDGPSGDGSASMASSRALVLALGCREGPSAMLGHAQVALDAEPVWSPWRPVAMLLAAYARSMDGAVELARSAFTQIVDTAEPLAPDARRVALAECALMASGDGDWRRAEQLVSEFWRSLRDAGADDYLTSLLGIVASAGVAIHRGDLRRAKAELSRVQLLRRLVSWAVPWFGVRCLTELARTQLRVADASGARASLAQARSILAHRPLLGTLPQAVYDLDHSLQQAPHTRADLAASLTDRELRLLPYLQTYLTLGEIGDRLGVSKNTIKTQAGAIYSKLGATSRSEAVEMAVRRGLLPPLDILAEEPAAT